MADISKYLKQLESSNWVNRYDACEELRVSEKVPKEVLLALQSAASDTVPLVADAARRALLVHSESPISYRTSFEDVQDSIYGKNESNQQVHQDLISTTAAQETPVDQTIDPPPPWFDEGEEIVVNKYVAPHVLGQPIEVYYYEPSMGYGYLGFSKESIGFLLPKGSSTMGSFHFGSGSFDFDGDGIADADDLGCLLVLGFVLLIGWIINIFRGQNLKRSHKLKYTIQIPYPDIQHISLEGCSLEISRSSRKPQKIKLRAGTCDGERLYRELYLHYPPAISKWNDAMQMVISGAQLPTQRTIPGFTPH